MLLSRVCCVALCFECLNPKTQTAPSLLQNYKLLISKTKLVIIPMHKKEIANRAYGCRDSGDSIASLFKVFTK